MPIDRSWPGVQKSSVTAKDRRIQEAPDGALEVEANGTKEG